MRLLVLPLASKLHPSGFYSDLLSKIRGLEGPVDVHDVVYPGGAASVDVGGYDAVAVIVLTGGTSRLGARLLTGYGGRVMIYSHPLHNSLPSALSMRLRLQSCGVQALLLHSQSLDGLVSSLSEAVKVADVINRLREVRIGHVGEEVPEEAVRYAELFGGEVVHVKPEEVGEEEPSTALEGVRLEGIEEDAVKRCLAAYESLKRLAEERRLDVLAIDCFPFLESRGYTPCIPVSLLCAEGVIAVCEADYAMIPLMLLSQALCGVTGWIANIYDAGEGWVKAAHCTIARNMAGSIRVMPHFESGKPAAIRGELPIGSYTLVSMSKDFSRIMVREAKVATPLSSQTACRTQHLIAVRRLGPGNMVNNHHLVTPCRASAYRMFGYLKGIEVC